MAKSSQELVAYLKSWLNIPLPALKTYSQIRDLLKETVVKDSKAQNARDDVALVEKIRSTVLDFTVAFQKNGIPDPKVATLEEFTNHLALRRLIADVEAFLCDPDIINSCEHPFSPGMVVRIIEGETKKKATVIQLKSGRKLLIHVENAAKPAWIQWPNSKLLSIQYPPIPLLDTLTSPSILRYDEIPKQVFDAVLAARNLYRKKSVAMDKKCELLRRNVKKLKQDGFFHPQYMLYDSRRDLPRIVTSHTGTATEIIHGAAAAAAAGARPVQNSSTPYLVVDALIARRAVSPGDDGSCGEDEELLMSSDDHEVEYLVKWKDVPIQHATWEARDALVADVPALVAEFDAAHPGLPHKDDRKRRENIMAAESTVANKQLGNLPSTQLSYYDIQKLKAMNLSSIPVPKYIEMPLLELKIGNFGPVIHIREDEWTLFPNSINSGHDWKIRRQRYRDEYPDFGKFLFPMDDVETMNQQRAKVQAETVHSIQFRFPHGIGTVTECDPPPPPNSKLFDSSLVTWDTYLHSLGMECNSWSRKLVQDSAHHRLSGASDLEYKGLMNENKIVISNANNNNEDKKRSIISSLPGYEEITKKPSETHDQGGVTDTEKRVFDPLFSCWRMPKEKKLKESNH